MSPLAIEGKYEILANVSPQETVSDADQLCPNVYCTGCQCQQIAMMSHVPLQVDREEYLACLLNQNPDIDLRLLESVKFLMMEKALCVYRQIERRKQCCYTPAADFWMFMSLCPVRLFQQRINPLGDSVKADEVCTCCNTCYIGCF